MTDPRTLQIDIVSDVVCPWCIIGYRQLEKALERFDTSLPVEIRWHPFELNPQMPPEGQDAREHIAQKYGATAEQSRSNRERLRAIGASLGIRFSYGDGFRVVNTFNAHQLLSWATEHGLQTQLKLALFEAYFSGGRDVSDPEVLCDVAASVGLSDEAARDALTSQRFASAVRTEQARWREENVYAVPTFVFNNVYSVSGAQDAEVFGRILEKAQQRGLI